jgi:hypothetical protein
MKSWWGDNIQKVVIAFWSYCYVFVWNSWCSLLQIKLSTVLAVQLTFCFQYHSPSDYQYTSKAAVIKLSFSVHVMLLMCCRLQELGLKWCVRMTDRGLLEGIGSLQGLTLLHLIDCYNLSAGAFSELFQRPSMNSIIFLELLGCPGLDDGGLIGIANRCNKLTYLHI